SCGSRDRAADRILRVHLDDQPQRRGVRAHGTDAPALSRPRHYGRPPDFERLPPRGTMGSGDRRLYERRGELEALSGTLGDLRGGGGAVLLLEGPAGIGKTALLEEACELAARQKGRVLFAR